ncbi:MAG: type II toxin-antitoxin system HicB family antitoxin [Chloroflexia bacterium]|nr:type II toxin-antitoxin system HicB family antitoxin [Chloroflexia bacterium]
MRRYTILLTPDVDDGGYTVTVPLLEGCVTEGDTIEEAIVNARDVTHGYVEPMTANGETVPEEPLAPQLLTIDVDVPAPVVS